MQGDVTMDWNLASTPRAEIEGDVPTGFDSVVARCQPGGAALLWQLIDRVARGSEGGVATVEVLPPGGPFDAVFPGDRRYHHSYATWSSQLAEDGKPASGTAWRVDASLGVDPRETPPPVDARAERSTATAAESSAVTDPERADLIVLDDANFGFRDEDPFPACIRDAGSDAYPWVLLKMARPVATGRLWDHLLRRPDRLVVVVPIEDLRAADAQVTRGLSWERTAQDLVWECTYNPALSVLSQCASAVVSFDTSGVIVLQSRAGSDPATDGGARLPPVTARLLFDPGALEGDWARRRPGGMVGYTTCLVAGIARQLVLEPDAPDLDLGVQRGLASMRALHEGGYDVQAVDATDPGTSRPALQFPFDRVAHELIGEAKPFAVAPIVQPPNWLRRPRSEAPSDVWTILSDRYRNQNFNAVAARIVCRGPDRVLSDVPRGEFGDLVTVDRQEIEGFRSVASLVLEYDSNARVGRPLNLAVFGPPGSGKSWSIVQVVKSTLPHKIEKLTFNLSQLHDPSELLDAFHQVRDKVLAGKLPLVFWDEFDTSLQGQKLGWLRYFLAPMQDGEFQHGPLTHSIGRAIFVFAGGAAERMEDFAPGEELGMDETTFKSVKGPDFVSRLKGYVNILGPNRRTDGPPDPYFRIRRAILLRSILLRDEPQLFHNERIDGTTTKVLSMDEGVLRAFIQTREYLHGARSLESIVAMSELSEKPAYERSALPAPDQLETHVEASDFLGLVRQLELQDTELVTRLAEWAHVIYCDQLLADTERGYEWGEDDDSYLREHPPLDKYAGKVPLRGKGRTSIDTLVSYANLPEHHQQENRANVRDIPNKLAAANYAIRQMTGRSAPLDTDLEAVVIELLAELEHDRWMMSRLETGWRWAEKRTPERYENDAIVPWVKMTHEEIVARYGAEFADRIGDGVLPEHEIEKDRALARGIPRILSEAGYTIVKIADR